VIASRADLEKLAAAIIAKPQAMITVDLEGQRVKLDAVDAPVSMPAGARQSLVSGNWDFLGQLLDGASAVKETTNRIPYLTAFRA
jgi:3-isopropylmalate/(R)-2-methylmalate dehydratase small subunit